MLGKAHMAIGGILGAVIAVNFPYDPAALWAMPVGLVAAGLADVLDSEHAAGREPLGVSWSSIKYTLRRKHKSVVDIALLLPRAIVALLLDIISRLIPHRKLTHWLLTWAVLSLLALEITYLLGGTLVIPLAFAVGYLSHLVADGFTVSGVPYLGPLYNRSLHLLPKMLRFRYDSPAQWLIVFALLGLVVSIYTEQWGLLFRWGR